MQQREDADAVLAGPVGNFGLGQFGRCRQQIAQGCQVSTGAARRHHTWPARHEGHPVSTFPGVTFDATQVAHAVVPVLLNALVRRILGDVVAGKDQQSVVTAPGALHGRLMC